MRRREFISLLGGAVTWPLAARAQQTAMPVVGIIWGGSPGSFAYFLPALHRGLRETGYIEGRNVAIEFRWADDRYERVPVLAEDLVHRQASVIVATGGGGLVAKEVLSITATIPIVFMSNLDPVRSGMVASLNHPGGNATGFHIFSSVLEPKKLELLDQVVDKSALFVMLINPTNPNTEADTKAVPEAARKLGRRVMFVTVAVDSELEAAFTSMIQQQAGGLIVANDPFLFSLRENLVAMTARHKLPAVYEFREFVQAGGLMSYGSSILEAFHQVGIYTGRILNGAKPADLPVQQPTKFELVVNLKTANALGIEMPTAILLRADEVLE